MGIGRSGTVHLISSLTRYKDLSFTSLDELRSEKRNHNSRKEAQSMAVATKRRRKIRLKEREFVWYISPDEDSSNDVLHISSQDKRFIIKFHLGQPTNLAFLIVLGREFAGAEGTGGVWRRFRCQKWDEQNSITPATIKRIVEWGLSDESIRLEVDYHGEPIPLGGHCKGCGYKLNGSISPTARHCPKCDRGIEERLPNVECNRP
jgi:hypothetical protein